MRFYVLISSLLIILFTIATIGAVLLRRNLRRTHLTFTLFASSVLLWIYPYLMWQMSTAPAEAIFWCRLLVAGSILIPATYLQFITTLTGDRVPRLLWTGYLLAAGLLVAAAGTGIVRTVEPRMVFPHWPVPGVMFGPYLVYFATFTALAFYFLIRRYRRSSMQGRNQLKYLLWGTAVGFAGGGTNFILWFNVPIPPVGHGFSVFYILGIGYSIVKFRLMEFNFMVVRLLGFLVMLVGVAGGVALATAWVWRSLLHLGMEVPDFWSWWAMLAFALTLGFPLLLLHRPFDSFVENRLFKRTHDYRSRLRELAAHSSGQDDEEDIFNEFVRSLQGALGLRRAAVFFRNELEQRHRLKAHIGFGAATEEREEATAAIELVRQRLETGSDSVALEELLAAAPNGAQGLRRIFEQDDLAVPIRVGAALLGFLVIGLRNDRKLYSSHDVVLLESVTFHLGLTIRARQLERRANQAEKLISLGTLAAGLAHELRNPLVSIRTFTALMAEQGDDAEFRREFRAVVERDVLRIGTIVEHVAAFAENSRVKFATVRVDEVIQAVYEIARPEFARANVGFVAPAAGLPAVHGNYGQLLQVFLNLFQNAIHALEGRPGACVEVRATVLAGEDGARALVLAVADNGPGIEAALRERIFEPFITTKATGDGRAGKRGMGLGLAIVKRIVEGHRGAITVTSEPGRGTIFLVHLPCLP